MAMKRKNLPEVVPELFEHEEFGQFRFIKRGMEIWFAAVDVCNVLDIQNPTMAVKQLDDDERAKFNLGHPYGEMNFVNEFGLYNLILSSRKPEAKKFKRWVTHEVLPSIRKYGYYSVTAEKKLIIYSGKPAPELSGEKLTYDEFFDVIDKLLSNEVEIRQLND